MVSLRHFQPADAPVLLAFQENGTPLEKIQEMIRDWNGLSFQGRYYEMFAILREEKIVGMLSFYQQSDSIISIGPEIFPAFRRQGIAREAMGLALAAAKGKGYSVVLQQVRSDNQASIALHRSLGFETDGYPYRNRKGNEVLIFLKAL